MPDPMYRQIAQDLLQKIESGELGRGDRLPTELELREAQGQPFRLTVSLYPADRNQFSVTVGDVPSLADPDAIHDQAVGISSGRSHA